jgi:hypothetical protein
MIVAGVSGFLGRLLVGALGLLRLGYFGHLVLMVFEGPGSAVAVGSATRPVSHGTGPSGLRRFRLTTI